MLADFLASMGFSLPTITWWSSIPRACLDLAVRDAISLINVRSG